MMENSNIQCYKIIRSFRNKVFFNFKRVQNKFNPVENRALLRNLTRKLNFQ